MKLWVVWVQVFFMKDEIGQKVINTLRIYSS